MTDAPVIPRAHYNFASVYGLGALAIALVVHISTFTPYSLMPSNPLFWIMHVGIFPLFFAMIFAMQKWSASSVGPLGFKTKQLQWREIVRFVPPWAAIAIRLLFGYAIINFFLSIRHLPPRGSGGSTSPLDFEQARHLVRAFSGHWLVFYAAPSLYFLFVPKNARPAESWSQSAA